LRPFYSCALCLGTAGTPLGTALGWGAYIFKHSGKISNFFLRIATVTFIKQLLQLLGIVTEI